MKYIRKLKNFLSEREQGSERTRKDEIRET